VQQLPLRGLIERARRRLRQQLADGSRAMSASLLSARLDRWMARCAIRDAAGRPARVTLHQFRHILGTR
jgi:hypothetical protein